MVQRKSGHVIDVSGLFLLQKPMLSFNITLMYVKLFPFPASSVRFHYYMVAKGFQCSVSFLGDMLVKPNCRKHYQLGTTIWAGRLGKQAHPFTLLETQFNFLNEVSGFSVYQRRRLISHANAKSKSEKFPPPHQDGALGFPLGASHRFDPSGVPPDVPFTSASFTSSKEQDQSWSGPLVDPPGAPRRKKHGAGGPRESSKLSMGTNKGRRPDNHLRAYESKSIA